MGSMTNDEILLLNKYVPYPMIIFNDQRTLFFNSLFEELDIDESSMSHYAHTRQTNIFEKSEIYILSKAGEERCFELSTEPVIIEEMDYYLSYLIEITEKKLQEEKLIKMCTMRDRMLDINNSIINMTDLNEVLKMILENALIAIDKASLGSFFILDDDFFKLVSYVGFSKEIEEFHLPVKDSYLYAITDGKMDRIVCSGDFQGFEKIYPVKTEEGVLIQSTISAPIYTNNSLLGIINVDSTQKDAFDEDDLKSMEFVRNNIEIAITNHLSYIEKASLAKYDSLTKTYNRNFINEQFKLLKEKALCNKEKFYVVMLDIDKLKTINDKYGHLMGDKVIVRIASELFKITTKNDVIIRFGGDEFVGIFFNINKECLKHKLDGINHNLKCNPEFMQTTMIKSSFSYGIATFPKDGTELDDLVKVADEKMYRKKEKH